MFQETLITKYNTRAIIVLYNKIEVIIGFIFKHNIGRVIYALELVNYNLFKLYITINMIIGYLAPTPKDKTIVF
jgi:hypothetical protein